MQKLEHLSFSR